MTVQTVLPIAESSEPEDLAELDRLCQKVKEVTQETNDQLIIAALKRHRLTVDKSSKLVGSADRYDVSEAIAFLLDEKNSAFLRNSLKPATTNNWTDTIVDTQDDLAKAIAASLNDAKQPVGANKGGFGPSNNRSTVGLGGQVTAEDQELSKVIEASLAESQSSQTGYSAVYSSFFTDPLNPHDRERSGLWPVGLKNVGNTCWFNVVIQALFHIPAFRQQVLDFHYINTSAPVTEYKGGFSAYTPMGPKELQFMEEIRKLFALLICSKRKYVDPTGVIDVLRRNDDQHKWNSGTLDSQQDVSEFTHLVLQWLEDAFALQTKGDRETKGERSADPSLTDNPMLELFYGSYANESSSDPIESPPQREKFSQYVLQVNEFDNLHDSLEASVSAFPPVGEDGVTPSTPVNCHWFTHLPPVMLFELSRFQYNKVDNRAEKIHRRFNFPLVLYMDRYMSANRELVREKRVRVQQLRDQLKSLKDQLAAYQAFGSGSVKLPIADVLTYTLEFSESKKVSTGKTWGTEKKEADVNGNPSDLNESRRGSQPTRSASPMDFTPVDDGKIPMIDSAMDYSDVVDVQVEPIPSNMVVAGDTEMVEGTSHNPVAGVSETDGLMEERDLVVVRQWLKRWREIVQTDVERLENEIAAIEDRIRGIYESDSLRKHGYRLHSVMVHEGQATSGHYWAFLSCPSSQTWLKFNDIQVTKVSWEEVQKDSFGGVHNASAYCLVYAYEGRLDLFDDFSHPLDVESPVSLTDTLRLHVHEHNQMFAQEVAQWESKRTVAAPTIPQSMETEPENWDQPSQQHSIGPTAANTPTAAPTQHLSAATAPLRQRNLSSASSTTSTGAPTVADATVKPDSTTDSDVHFCTVHGMKMGNGFTRSCLSDVLKKVELSQVDTQQIVSLLMEQQFNTIRHKVEQFIEGGCNVANEPRLTHILAFFMMSRESQNERLARYILLKHLEALEPSSDFDRRLRSTARDMAGDMNLTDDEMLSNNMLYVEYMAFLKSMLILITIFDRYQKSAYEEGLKFCFCLETLLSQIPPRSPKYIDRRFIRQIQQMITEKYSAELSVRIMSCGEENLEKLRNEVKTSLLPSIAMLMKENPADKFCDSSNIIQPWLDLVCQLNIDKNSKTSQILQEVVALLMDTEGSQSAPMPKLSAKVKVVVTDLPQKHQNLLSQAQKLGMLQLYKSDVKD